MNYVWDIMRLLGINVVETIPSLPTMTWEWEPYHLSKMVMIWGMVYDCFDHVKCLFRHRPWSLELNDLVFIT